ncbi:unnamed protein product [Allacma fusca]|uniref:Uncharacterized protein n=1 Tax=Allacma fusca TaxID=39272 RepID=A0A8J2K784_9HEXA|nr:unnamed protein product [Allacma fusca]
MHKKKLEEKNKSLDLNIGGCVWSGVYREWKSKAEWERKMRGHKKSCLFAAHLDEESSVLFGALGLSSARGHRLTSSAAECRLYSGRDSGCPIFATNKVILKT